MTAKRTDFAHPNCHAAALKDCSPKISGEHTVSNAILRAISLGQKTVEVSGKIWQPPGVCQKVGIKSLVANILCERHNNALSGFDAAGSGFFEAILDLHETFHTRRISEVHEFYGPDLERWLLKTRPGWIVSGDTGFALEDKGEALLDWKPPIEWLRILFENSPFPPRCGLYVSQENKGIPQTTGNTILRTAAVFDSEGNVIGLQASLFYHELFLIMDAAFRFASTLPLRGSPYRPAVFLFGDVKGIREIKLQLKWGGHPFSNVTIPTTIFPKSAGPGTTQIPPPTS